MANIKFSAFTQKVVTTDVDFLVGYTGADNVRIAPSVFDNVYLPLAGGTMTGVVGVVAPDNFKWNFGTGSDLQIFHNATDSIIYNGAGGLMLRGNDVRIQVADASETMATFTANGAVDLYYDNTLRLDTTDDGVAIRKDNSGALGPVLLLDNTAGGNGDSSAIVFASGGNTYQRAQIKCTADLVAPHNGSIEFYTGRSDLATLTEKMRIAYDGNVGIGTTAPAVGLQLGNSVLGETKLAIFNSEGGGEVGLTLQSRTNRAKLRVADNDTSAYVVAEGGISSFGPSASADATNISVVAGDVGIGTITPVSVLNIKAEDPTLTIESSRTTVVADEILGQIDFRTNEGSFLGAPATSARIRVDESQYAATTMSFWTSTNPGDVLTQQLTISPEGNAAFAGNIELGDGQQLQCGPMASGDLKVYWDTSDGNIVNKTGHLYIKNQSDDKSIYLNTDDGAGGDTTYIKVDGLSEYTEFPKNTRHLDNVYAQFGSSNDGHIYHTGTDMTIQNSYDDGDLKFKSDDGSGGVADYFWLDGGIVKTRVAKDMNFEDNVKASFGNVVTPDLEIYHDTGNSYIVDTGTGSLKVGAANWHLMDSALAAYMMTATPGAECNLYFNGSGRFITTSDGVKVTGQYNVAALNTAPASASAAGTLGEIRYTADYIYVCTATNTWKRTALSTW